MNSELEDLELTALLEELEKESNEIDLLCLEMDKIDNLLEQFHSLKAEKDGLKKLVDKKNTSLKLDSAVRALKNAFKVMSQHFSRYYYENRFIEIIQRFMVVLVKFKTIQPLQNLDFKHLNDSFQNIKQKNHIVMLQPRLQSINSIEA